MAPSSNKRARRSDNDSSRGRSPSQADPAMALQQMFQDYKNNVIRLVRDELSQCETPENALPCPFQRRNPHRYAYVKDPACNGRGFKDIADLRDHIKRAHSSRYGCHYCKERFQGRDNAVEDAARAHRGKCKRYANREVCAVSPSKPEVMSPEDDARYFRLDFRKKSNKSSSADRQCEQYWEICKAIWPEYESRAAFEQLDLRKKSGAIHVARLSEIMELALCDVQVDQFLDTASGSVSSPSYRESPSRALANFETDEAPTSPYGQLAGWHNVPQPTEYAEARNPRDSAYGSSSQTDESQTCWRNGVNAGGEQMLMDDDNVQMELESQLVGISARYYEPDVNFSTWCDPSQSQYMNGGLDDDELMLTGDSQW